MVTSTNSTSSSNLLGPQTPLDSKQATSLASEETFLKLFVAQLKNQDPLSPNAQDPTQMVSELAQFSQLEQMMNIGSGVNSIVTDLNKMAPASGSGSGSTQASSGQSGTTQSGSTQGS